jgi:hypothetical protein
MMSGVAFEIRSFTVLDCPANERGNRLIAGFALHRAGMLVKGWVLLEKADGSIKLGAPSAKTNSGAVMSVELTDGRLMWAITKRAGEVYTLLTGRALGGSAPGGVVPDFGP